MQQLIINTLVRWPYLIFIPITVFAADGKFIVKVTILIICLLTNFYYNLIPYYLSQYFHTRPAFEFISKYGNLKLIRHSANDYFDSETLSFDLRNILVEKKSNIRNWYNKNIDANTYIYEVKSVEGENFPINAKVFTGEFGTLIFVPHSPDSIKPFSKFKLLHEYFHASEVSLFYERELIFISSLPILFIVFIFIFLQLSLLVLGLSFLSVLIMWLEYKYYWVPRKWSSVVNTEKISDILAIKFLDIESRMKIKSSPYIDHLIGDDINMADFQNKDRKNNFVKYIISGVKDEDIYNMLNETYRSHSWSLNLILLFIGIILALQAYSVSWWTVIYCLAILILTFLISMFVCYNAYRYYTKECEKKLGISLTQSSFFKRNSQNTAATTTRQ